jgi:hypothetical protein
MIKEAKRYFNTSGPNRPEEHYTLKREKLVEIGLNLVEKERYFTIWAPRQTGKSTYLTLLAKQLKNIDYKVTYVSVENFREEPLQVLMRYLLRRMNKGWETELKSETFGMLYDDIAKTSGKTKFVLFIDEIEGLNPELFHQFLHTIRNLYHFRSEHSLKSIILIGVSNIVGVVQDHASPFNIADNLEVPYFSTEETYKLLHMHEEETGQFFDEKVKSKISEITANQPGLVNGFAYQLVERYPKKEVIDYEDFLIVEDWYLTEAIDKNISNIINKAKEHRLFVEKLLFTEGKEKFKINDERIKFLHSHGLIRKDKNGYVEFWVPIYRKAVYDAFYPYNNGETKEQLREINLAGFFMHEGKVDFNKLVEGYRTYVKRRGFRYFREKDEEGNWKQIKEAAMIYSFESFIQALLQVVGGKSYLEPHAGQGNCDMIVNIEGKETVFEFKIYRDHAQYERGKKQVAYYSKSLSIDECVYLVFVSAIYKELGIKDEVLQIDGVTVRSYIIFFDEVKDF